MTGTRQTTGRRSRLPADAPQTVEAGDRKMQILTAAAALFAEKGYDRTSTRDIAAAVGILSGSIYYHFTSKEEIFVEVHSFGMKILTEAAKAASEGGGSPWDRLERVAAAHCRALLESRGFMLLVFPRFPEDITAYRSELVHQRDEYEGILAALVEDLDLPQDLDPHLFRLQFLGALNWSQTWYRPGTGLSPEQIGRHLVRMLRPR